MVRSEPTVPVRERRLPADLVGPGLVTGLVGLAVFVILAVKEGGFPPTVWYPAGLFLLLLLTVVAASYRGLFREVPRWTVLALAFLALFTIWSFASISWADVRADAWDGANRTLLYLIVFALFALLPIRVPATALLLAVFVVATAAIGGVELIRASTAADPTGFFLGTRFGSPTGYQNANAALFTTAVWPAVFLASRREVPVLARGLMLACAGLLVDVAVLAQSRAWIIVVPLVALLMLALVPGRIRSAIALAPVACTTALAWPRLTAVYDATGARGLHTTLHSARGPVAIGVALLFVLGIAWALVDRRLSISELLTRRIALALGVTGCVVALVVLVAALALGGPSRRVSHAWHQFTSETKASDSGSHFASGLGGGRYDYWRVGILEFRSAPVWGIGVDNFAQRYLTLRRGTEEPLYPHSVEIRLLAGTGLVGTALFLGFLACALAAARRTWRSYGIDRFAHGVIGTLLVMFGYWWVHGSVDWFWEFPALAAPAFAWLGLAAGLGRAEPSHGAVKARHPAWRVAVVIGAAAAVVFTGISYVLPWLSARDVSWAAASWRVDRREAFSRLDQARRLNFLSDRPDVVAGAIASRTGDSTDVRRYFNAALERNPKNWYPYFELGVLDSLEGRRASALRRLRTASRLAPHEPLTAKVIRHVQRGEPIRPGELDSLFVERVRERLR